MVAARLTKEVDRSQDAEDIAEFRDWLIQKGRSPKTQRTYVQSTTLLSRFLESRGMPALEEVRREHIEDWLGYQYESGNKPSTVRNRSSRRPAVLQLADPR